MAEYSEAAKAIIASLQELGGQTAFRIRTWTEELNQEDLAAIGAQLAQSGIRELIFEEQEPDWDNPNMSARAGTRWQVEYYEHLLRYTPPTLQQLSFVAQLQGGKLLEAISDQLPALPIESLEFRRIDKVDSEHMAALAGALPNTSIQHLAMDETSLWTDDIKELAKGLVRSQINDLSLRMTNFGGEGMEALLEVLPHTRLGRIDLSLNNFSERKAIVQAKLEEKAFQSGLGDMVGDAAENLSGFEVRLQGRAFVAHYDAFLKGDRSADVWAQITRGLPSLMLDWKKSDDVEVKVLELAEIARSTGLPTRDLVLNGLPLRKALEWLDTHGDPLSIKDFLTPDGAFPQDRFLCYGGAAALCLQVELWDSRKQMRKAIASLPEAEQAFLPTHQLLTTLGARDAAKQQGRA